VTHKEFSQKGGRTVTEKKRKALALNAIKARKVLAEKRAKSNQK
jgi:hypothetical protein